MLLQTPQYKEILFSKGFSSMLLPITRAITFECTTCSNILLHTDLYQIEHFLLDRLDQIAPHLTFSNK